MLFSSLENWQGLFDHVDCKAPISDFEGKPRSFDELLKATLPIAAENISTGAIVQRYRVTNSAMDRLETDLMAAELDVLIIIGDDQREIFQDACRPAIGIFLVRQSAMQLLHLHPRATGICRTSAAG